MKVRRPGAVTRAKKIQAGPCKRHRKGELAGWMPVENDQSTRWAIAEFYRCQVCQQDMAPRLATGTIKRTQREAMLAYGLTEEYIALFFQPKAPAQFTPAPVASSAIEVPASGWPFQESSRPEYIAIRAAAQAAERQARADAMEGR